VRYVSLDQPEGGCWKERSAATDPGGSRPRNTLRRGNLARGPHTRNLASHFIFGWQGRSL